MGIPARARYQQQGPAANCVISGLALGWLSCTAYAAAMGVDKSTLNSKHPTGCYIRRMTGDTSGGLTLLQVQSAIQSEYGFRIDVYTGSLVVPPNYIARQLRAGRGAVAQGNAGALVGTTWRCTGGPVNHAVWVNEGKGWHKVGPDTYLPTHVLVYDPAADGRKASWGKADQGPSWWPWAVFVKFMFALHPWGDDDPRTILNQGIEGVYCAVFPDTEPHYHSHFGGKRTTPFPDRVRGKKGSSAVARRFRPGPGTTFAGIPGDILSVGELFTAYQTAIGTELDGSTTWYGDHGGTRWVHESGLEYKGGST